MAKFKGSYERLLGAVTAAADSEDKLRRRVRELQSELVSNANKVVQALKLAEEDATTIDELKKQVEAACGLVDAANVREEQTSGEIARLRQENSGLAALMQKQQALLGVDGSLEELLAERDALRARVKEAEAVLEAERERAGGLIEEIESGQEKFRRRKETVRELERQATALRADIARGERKAEGLEGDVVRLKTQLEERDALVASQRRQLEDAETRVIGLDRQLTQQRALINEGTAEQQRAAAAASRLQSTIDEQVRAARAARGCLRPAVA
jgi:chromosome segregation ATPase